MRLAGNRRDFERQKRARRHDDEPWPPPLAMPKRPALDEACRPVGRQGKDEDPKSATARRPYDELGKREAPRVRVMSQVLRQVEQPRSQAQSHENDDGHGKGQPQHALDELVGDDDDKPGLASHGGDCKLDAMFAHRARFVAVLALSCLPGRAGNGSVASASPELIAGRPVRLDEQHKLLSWSRAGSPYALVARLAWQALETKFPVQDNGVETWLAWSRFDPTTFEGVSWPHNPAGLYAMLADSAARWYAFSGDWAAVDLTHKALDYQLEHGTTPPDWDWARVPYASAGAGDVDYRGADDEWCDFCGRGDGIGVIEPDKVGELGYAYLQFHELTGEVRYRDAAIACADALAKHLRAGDETHSPWPFRVYARTNVAREEYTSNVIGAIDLLDGLSRLSLGDSRSYARARAVALAWLLRVPVTNDGWSGYFEDIEIQPDPWANPNQYSALRTATWLIAHPDDDPKWRQHAAHLIAWATDAFGGDTASERGTQWGATVMSEQAADRVKMGSHTARLGAASALWYEATGDVAARERAARSLNWATYVCDDRGVVAVGNEKNEGWWFTDGYGDYTRHFLVAMAAVPEWAPPGELHLLRSSSVVTHIEYERNRASWSTFSKDATDTLRAPSRPTSVTAAGAVLKEQPSRDGEYAVRPLASGDVLVRVHHAAEGPVVVTTSAEPARAEAQREAKARATP